MERNHKTSQHRDFHSMQISCQFGNSIPCKWEFPNCSNNRDFIEVISCLFEYFGCQNIRKATDGRLNVGKDATSIEFSSMPTGTYIN